MFAAQGNPLAEVIRALVEAGAEVNARADDGRTPLMFAAQGTPSAEVIQALVEAGAEVDARTDDGVTPLMYAAGIRTYVT